MKEIDPLIDKRQIKELFSRFDFTKKSKVQVNHFIKMLYKINGKIYNENEGNLMKKLIDQTIGKN